MKNAMKFFALLFSSILLFSACKKDESCEDQVDLLGINQLQLLGSHNSYRQRTYGPILQFMYDNSQMLPEGFNPDELDYTHVPLDEQFNDYGIRSIELDVFNDPNGGLFYYRMGHVLIGESPESGLAALIDPGLKVLHIPDVDYNTNYLTFKDALNAVKSWSDAHPRHLPLVIMVEPKEDDTHAVLGDPFTTTIPFDKTSLGTIDQEIKDVFGSNLEQVLTPDNVRGAYATLNAAVRAGNWPAIASARGKVIFVMLPSGTEKADYLDGHAGLAGRAMFVFSDPDQAETAFINFDDPEAAFSDIQQLVGEGYFIRTRTDADTKEARSGYTGRREAAFNSGAQILSTDYYRPDGRPGWTNYSVAMPGGGVARLSPRFDAAVQFTCPITE